MDAGGVSVLNLARKWLNRYGIRDICEVIFIPDDFACVLIEKYNCRWGVQQVRQYQSRDSHSPL